MKKVFGIIALAIALVACTNNEIDLRTNDQSTDTTGSVTISATLAPKTGGTKAVSESGGNIVVNWATTEHLAILYEVSSVKKMADAEITAVDGDGKATITFTVDGGTPDNTPCTIVYPLAAAKDDHSGVKDAATLLAAQDGTLNANLDVRVGAGKILVSPPELDVTTQPAAQFAIFKFTVRKADGTTAISTRPLTITIGTQDYVITPATATDVLYAALPAVSEQKVEFDAKDTGDKTYTCAKVSTTFAAGNYYQSTLKMHEYVLMGEGYNLKWATCNVGADNPQEYGDYFAWGETATKEDYNQYWSGYSDYNSSYGTFPKYNLSGGKTVLDSEDDAASVNWSGSWRTPTEAEWNALLNTTNFTWAWTTDYLEDSSNHAGMVVTSMVTGYTGNKVFLPAAGDKVNKNFYNNDSYGMYWSSTLSTTNSNVARFVYLQHNGSVTCIDGARYYGFSIRPVAD